MSTPNSHNEWHTPPELFKVLNEEFHFDLDAAAAIENTLCKNFITAEMDALKVSWKGRTVWCNPPYGHLPAFVQRGHLESEHQRNTVVMLIPAYTDPAYFFNHVMKAHEVRFLKGRLSFIDGSGQGKKMNARFPSIVVVWKWLPGITIKQPNIFAWDWKAQIPPELEMTL